MHTPVKMNARRSSSYLSPPSNHKICNSPFSLELLQNAQARFVKQATPPRNHHLRDTQNRVLEELPLVFVVEVPNRLVHAHQVQSQDQKTQETKDQDEERFLFR